MANYNLPPGVTDADIDRAMGGDEPRCWCCGEWVEDVESAECVVEGTTRLLCDPCAGIELKDENRRLMATVISLKSKIMLLEHDKRENHD